METQIFSHMLRIVRESLKFPEVRFHTYWYMLIVLQHLNHILDTLIVLQCLHQVLVYMLSHLNNILVYADGAAGLQYSKNPKNRRDLSSLTS